MYILLDLQAMIYDFIAIIILLRVMNLLNEVIMDIL
jgi:hypothetical protein